MKDEDRKRVPQLKDLHIDIGAKDGEEARRLVRVGDVAVIDAEPVEFPNNRFVSRSMDNRIGCYVALEAARLVAEAGGAPGDVYALAVTQEEITFGGARTTRVLAEPGRGDRRRRDVRDRPARARPRSRSAATSSAPGPVLTRGSTLDPTVFELLHEAGEAESIPFTVTASARATGTDADAFHIARAGIPSSVVSVPLRYMHSRGGDGPARRRRERGEADRGVRAAARSRHRLPRADPPPALRHRRDAAAAGVRRARAGAARGRRRGARRHARRRRRLRRAHGRGDHARSADAGGRRRRARSTRAGRRSRPPRPRPTRGCARRT